MHEAMRLPCLCCWHCGLSLLACHTGPLSHGHILAVCRGLWCCGPSNHGPCHREQPSPIGQASSRLLTPALPSLPIRPELVLSGISGGIQQRDLGQSFSVPFPLWPPALAALPLLVIVRGVPGRQWAIQ